jgi:FlaA1/EpsC-like NDP-sugar epimerase
LSASSNRAGSPCFAICRQSSEPIEPPAPVTIVGSRPGAMLHAQLWGYDASVGVSDHTKIMRLSRPAVDPGWLAAELAELERLADEGDTLEVVAKLNAIVKAPRRERVTATPEGLRSSEGSPRTAAPPSPSA